MELHLRDVTGLAADIRARAVSPVEVVDAYLVRIDELNPILGAVCTVRREEAREEARHAEALMLAGRELGALHGVPILVKDLTVTKGTRTTFGSRAYAEHVPDFDAIVVERACAAGAIVLGKTQTSEFALSGFTRNDLFGVTRNPWDHDRTPGGSSGGSAVAVATAMAPVAEGSDTGGSIRIPASCTGSYGLKPQFGRIPGGALDAHHDTLLTFGPITWTVRDAALLLDVWAGPDDRDPWSLPEPEQQYVRALDGDVAGLRVAYSRDLGHAVHPDVAAAVDGGVGVLESLGCAVEPIALSGWADANLTWRTLADADAADRFGHLLPAHESVLMPETVEAIRRGSGLTAADRRRAEQLRRGISDTIGEVFENYDVLVTPTLVMPPPPVDPADLAQETVNGTTIDPSTGWAFTCPFNLTGHPAASIPAGRTATGLPVGMQLVARRFREDVLLCLSARFEEAAPWHSTRPPGQPARAESNVSRSDRQSA